MVETRLAPGQYLFKSGEAGDSMYLVHRGTLKIMRSGHVIAELGEGSIVGELAVLAPELRSADAVAADNTHLLGVSQRTVEQLMSTYPSFGRAVVVELVRRLHAG